MEADLHEQGLPLLTSEELAELEGFGRTIYRPAGQLFFQENDPGDFALLIRKGYVKVERGNPAHIIDIRGPGEIVGEMAVIRKKPRAASIIAFDDVEALYLPGTRWLQFLYAHPRAFHALVAMVEEMADRATMKTIESELAIEQQLAKRIVGLIDLGLGKPSSDGTIILSLSQQELADLIGAKKLQSVKLVIRSLKASEIVSTGREVIKVLQLDALRQIAAGDLTTS